MHILSKGKVRKFFREQDPTKNSEYVVIKDGKEFYLITKDVKALDPKKLSIRRIGLRLGSEEKGKIALTKEAEQWIRRKNSV